MRLSKVAAVLMFAALTGGCGGGGSDDGGVSFSLSTSNVTFTSRSDGLELASPQSVVATAKDGTVFFAVTYGSGPNAPLEKVTMNTPLLSATATIHIVPKSGPTLGAGVFTDTITIRGCKDSGCSSEVGGSPKSIAVTYTVKEAPPGIALGASTVELSATRGQATLPAQDLMVTADAGASVQYSTGVSYVPNTGATDWLDVPATATAPGALRVGVKSTAVTGSHIARLTLTPTNTARAQSLLIYYNVREPTLVFEPSTISFNITSASPPAALQQAVNVTGSGGVTLSWTATSSTPLIGVSPTSGASGAPLIVSLSTGQLQQLAPGNYSGTVNFSYTGAQPGSIQLPVKLSLQLPNLTMVAPYVALTGSTEPLTVRGAGFNSMTTERILFGSTPAPAFTTISDTELRVTPPSLPAGRYSVMVENQANISRTLAATVVVDPVTYAYSAQTSTGTKSRIVYDAERRAIYVCNRSSEVVERYAFAAGVWSRTNSAQFGILRTMTLAPDGTEITIVSSSIQSLDPTSLAATSRSGRLFFAALAEQIEYGNDGWATISSTGDLGASTRAAGYEFRAHTVLDDLGRSYISARLASAQDGSRKFIASKGAFTPQPIYYEDIADHQIVATSVMRNAESLASDRTGERLVVVGAAATEVFDRSFSLLGNLPSTTLAVALTPNGQRAYTYDSSGSVRAFDLSVSLPSSSSVYPEISSPTTPADAPGTGIVMTISPDSNTLFIAGNQRVLIMPAP